MTPAYKITSLVQRHQKDVVLSIDDYAIESKKVTAVVGPNGSGKSTLLDLLSFITRPSEGSVSFFADTNNNEDQIRYRQQIGYVQQRPYLFNMSVEKNIGIGLKLRGYKNNDIKPRVDAIMADFNLGELKNRRGHGLSGGEIQKVALARAMVLEPKVLILDEPFSHLDKSSSDDIVSLIKTINLKQEQTIIFSTHDQILAQTLADNVCTLINGHVMPTLLLNVLNGKVDPASKTFRTDHLVVHIPAGFTSGTRLVIDASHLVLSRDTLDSSMRNVFKCRVQGLSEESGNIYVTVNAGEIFQVLITSEAWKELSINIEDEIWLSFKSTAVHVF